MAHKILVLSHAGVLEVNRALFQELARLGKEVVMIVPREWHGDLIRQLRFEARPGDQSLRVEALPVAFSGKGSLFFYRAWLSRVLGDWKPEFVFLDEEPWSLAALQTFLAFPRAQISFFTKENLNKLIPWPFSSLEQWVYRRAAWAFVVSDEVERVIRHKGYCGRVMQLHHSYDPALFQAKTLEERGQIRAQFGIPEHAVVLGYFGRLTEEKGLNDLTSALQRLQHDASLPEWFFCCVGNGPAEAETRQALGSLPQARYRMLSALTHDRVGSLLAAIDILVLPSRTTPRWKEQFGRILVEAMACGAAVVGSDSGEIPHLIARSGGGLVFREGHPEELAERLSDLLKAPQLLAQHREAGHHYVEHTLTHARVARALAEQIDEGTSGGTRRTP